MEYIIIKENKTYLKVDSQGKRSLTTNQTIATKFTKVKAEAFLQNCIKPVERKKYRIEKISDTNVIGEQKEQEGGLSPPLSLDIESIDILETCNNLQLILSQVNAYKQVMQTNLQQIEKQKCDVDHRIEFTKDNGKEFNAAEMVQIFKLERAILRERRKIKDSILMSDIVISSTFDDFKSGKVINRLKGLENREYAPRALNELF